MKSGCVAMAALLLVACGKAPEDDLLLRGTVEVREVDVAPIAAGRVIELRVEEGADVAAGDTMAILGAPLVAPDQDAAAAQVTAARAQLRDLEAGSDPQEIARAEAELRAREVEAERLVRDRDRLKALLDVGAIAPRDHEAAAVAAAVAQSQVVAARELVSLRRAGTRSARISAARAEVTRAEAALAGRRATAGEYVLVAPIAGVVLARLAEPGDLIAVGGAVVRIGAVASPWVRIFVPARVLPRLTVGDSAAIYPPGAGGAVGEGGGRVATAGRIAAINPRAEFVTRTALTEDERADLLFGVKVTIADSVGRFKPGMPVTVRLLPRVAGP